MVAQSSRALRNVLTSEEGAGIKALDDVLAKESEEIALIQLLEKAIASRGGNIQLSVRDIIGAGIGAAAGQPLTGVAAGRVIQSTPFLTGAGVTLNQLKKVAPILEKLTPAERGIISQIIQQLLDSGKATTTEETIE